MSVPQFDQTNDQVKGWQGTEVDCVLPSDAVASEALALNDSVELHSSTNKRFRKATGASASRYLGIVADSGGIASGATGRIIKGIIVSKTASGSISQGDLVSAISATAVAKITVDMGGYALAVNAFGRAMQDQTNGNTLLVEVWPEIRNT
jgi:hypothetical protein